MSLRATLAIAAGLTVIAGSALAAQADVKGQVLVRHNGKVQALASGASVKSGDQIIVGVGSAKVRYGANCVVEIGANSTASVRDASVCNGLVKPVSATAMQSEPTLASSIIPLAIGVGLLVAAVDASDDDDGRPISP